MEKRNFILPLHKACSTSTKELRPIFKSIFLVNGYAYATCGHIIVKHPLRLSNFVDDISVTVPVQDGGYPDVVAIPAKSYEQILTFDTAGLSSEGINCSSEDGRTAFFEYTNLTGVTIPDFEKAITNSLGRSTMLDCIGVSPEYLETAAKLMVGGSSGIKMQFTGIDKGILITPIDNDYDDQLVVVMPKIIEPTLFGDNDKQDT